MSRTRVLVVTTVMLATISACGGTSDGTDASDAPTSRPTTTVTPSSAPPTTTVTTTVPTTEPTTEPTTPPTTSPTSDPTSDPTSEATKRPTSDGAVLAGVWSSTSGEVNWTLHLEPDGTYTEDFDGQTGIGSGTFTLVGKQVRLKGESGTSRGTYDGTSLHFDDVVLRKKR